MPAATRLPRSEAGVSVDGVDRTGVRRRLPELVQLRRQVAVPERHVDPGRPPRAEVRRRLRPPAEARRHLRPRQPRHHHLLGRSVGDSEPTRNGRYPQGFQTPGAVRQITITTEPIGNYDSYNNWTFAGYVQDDLRLSSRLTRESRSALRRLRAHEPGQRPVRREPHLPGAQGDRVALRAAAEDRQEQLRARGSAWPGISRGDGERVLRASAGRYFTLGIKNSYYLAAVQDKADGLPQPDDRQSARSAPARSPTSSTA